LSEITKILHYFEERSKLEEEEGIDDSDTSITTFIKYFESSIRQQQQVKKPPLNS